MSTPSPKHSIIQNNLLLFSFTGICASAMSHACMKNTADAAEHCEPWKLNSYIIFNKRKLYFFSYRSGSTDHAGKGITP
jgi:hypothetical protein